MPHSITQEPCRDALVAASWERSASLHASHRTQDSPAPLSGDGLDRMRRRHRLAPVIPLAERLLGQHAADAGIILAIGDASGRLLWLGGDHRERERAEGALFVEGASWSESARGTSAPGLALAIGAPAQVRGEQHFAEDARHLHCSAVPIRDPDGGEILGVLDLTGGVDAAAPHSIALLEATAWAMSAELRSLTPAPTGSGAPGAPGAPERLSVLGRDRGLLSVGDTDVALSPRHSEILVLLAERARDAAELAVLLYGEGATVVTVRAEVLRLRRALAAAGSAMRIESGPYRLAGAELHLDVEDVRRALDRGAHRQALARYAGPMLPGSEAPGITALRARSSGRLREALLENAAVEPLLRFARGPEGEHDHELWHTALQLLPARSPARAEVVARLQAIDVELGATPLQRPTS